MGSVISYIKISEGTPTNVTPCLPYFSHISQLKPENFTQNGWEIYVGRSYSISQISIYLEYCLENCGLKYFTVSGL
jgi:hypothetical protein